MGRPLASASVLLWLCLVATATAQADGRHVRLRTAHGPIHVWSPADVSADDAGIVVYIHGYYTTVDRAWSQHRLAAQFEQSGVNALFVACEAPDGPRDPVRWSSLPALLSEVRRQLGTELPTGRVVVVAHSGGHRTLSRWLGDDTADAVVLVDAFYGELPHLRDWLARSDDHRLIDAAALTRAWTEPMHAELTETLVFDAFPAPEAAQLAGARDARIVYVRSQHDHMQLVTGGIALPLLLRASQLPAVREGALDAPLLGGSPTLPGGRI
ncbi:MAG TPA: hypothetical protein VFQ53_06815 [Kofleriaceae bacterium]|nr:hypothetical protein [Kofleriaceae bacterium]